MDPNDFLAICYYQLLILGTRSDYRSYLEWSPSVPCLFPHHLAGGPISRVLWVKLPQPQSILCWPRVANPIGETPLHTLTAVSSQWQRDAEGWHPCLEGKPTMWGNSCSRAFCGARLMVVSTENISLLLFFPLAPLCFPHFSSASTFSLNTPHLRLCFQGILPKMVPVIAVGNRLRISEVYQSQTTWQWGPLLSVGRVLIVSGLLQQCRG